MSLILDDACELSCMVRIAQHVDAIRVVEVCLPMVVTCDSRKVRKHSKRIDSFFASLLMCPVEGPLIV
jgi:hypothetical protein